MTDVAVAPQKTGRVNKIVAEPTAPPVAVKPAQTLRQAQPKKFAPSSLQPIGHDYEILAIKVPADWTFEDVLKPIAWANVAHVVSKDALSTRRDKIGSLIYVRSETGAFKSLLEIVGITLDQFGQPNGLNVEPWLFHERDAK